MVITLPSLDAIRLLYYYYSNGHDIMKHTRPYDLDTSPGIQDEHRVIEYLRTTNQYTDIEAVPATDIRQIADDIDCVIDGHPVSIKAQHAGLQYGHLYVELVRHTKTKQRRSAADKWQMQQWFEQYRCKNSDDNLWLTLSWWFEGKATHYLILQGTRLRLYRKTDIADYIQHHGFVHIRALSRAVLKQQNGFNTWCGYLNSADVPYLHEWTLP